MKIRYLITTGKVTCEKEMELCHYNQVYYCLLEVNWSEKGINIM